ncbi:hypothetical protein HZF08_07730 [Paenibacillus sp. CGMCC 1.16610]|uniref:Uncharacterized protein n=1 Tax=Paenibacillus anseongense TaxID=2682845 RepID=A0ABW9UE35_9BACL|nr:MULTISPECIES: hypothetical protein [Paenibacillus]MBA2938193.1 hypothetical protein [Paenibacillus sp. CGMCC 1.16610]MVQ37251.1 hypothetical protein [Paenibacillus anseongense]
MEILHKKRANSPYRIIGSKIEKRCSMCKSYKPLNKKNFYSSSTGSGGVYGFNSRCKVCTTKVTAEKIKKNKFYALAVSARSRYNKCGGAFECLPVVELSAYLEELYFAQEEKCFYTDVEMDWKMTGPKSFFHMSVERLDPEKGYTKGNIVLCLWFINLVKSNRNLGEFIDSFKWVISKKRAISNCIKRAQENESLVRLGLNFAQTMNSSAEPNHFNHV